MRRDCSLAVPRSRGQGRFTEAPGGVLAVRTIGGDMVLRRHREPRPEIGVLRMAAALMLAAFLGGALGLIWQSAGFGEDEPEEEAAATAAEAVS